MYVKQDRISARTYIEAMLGEARRAKDDAESSYDYYKKEYERAQEKFWAADNTVRTLEHMLEECDVLACEQKRYEDNRF